MVIHENEIISLHHCKTLCRSSKLDVTNLTYFLGSLEELDYVKGFRNVVFSVNKYERRR